jgi:hypothetical protein
MLSRIACTIGCTDDATIERSSDPSIHCQLTKRAMSYDLCHFSAVLIPPASPRLAKNIIYFVYMLSRVTLSRVFRSAVRVFSPFSVHLALCTVLSESRV